MDSKIVFVALVLIASFALPTLATFEKDFISPEAVKAILKKTNVNVVPSVDAISALTGKTIISNDVFDVAILNNIANGVNAHCYESCYVFRCVTELVGCACSDNVCRPKSLTM